MNCKREGSNLSAICASFSLLPARRFLFTSTLYRRQCFGFEEEDNFSQTTDTVTNQASHKLGLKLDQNHFTLVTQRNWKQVSNVKHKYATDKNKGKRHAETDVKIGFSLQALHKFCWRRDKWHTQRRWILKLFMLNVKQNGHNWTTVESIMHWKWSSKFRSNTVVDPRRKVLSNRPNLSHGLLHFYMNEHTFSTDHSGATDHSGVTAADTLTVTSVATAWYNGTITWHTVSKIARHGQLFLFQNVTEIHSKFLESLEPVAFEQWLQTKCPLQRCPHAGDVFFSHRCLLLICPPENSSA